MYAVSHRMLLPLMFLSILLPAQVFSQLLPQWIVTGKSQFTGWSTVKGIAACEGGYYLTGGLIENDFVLQISDDAGMSWTRTLTLKRYGFGEVQPPLSRPFMEVIISSVERPTPELCFAYGGGSYEMDGTQFPFLLRSLDSGRTWNEVPLADSAKGINWACIAMKDARHGIRNGGYIDADHSVLYRTSDGGDTWSTVDIPFVDYRTLGLYFAKDGTLFAKEYRNEQPVYRSTDDGQTWEYRGVLPSGRVPYFISAELGWLAYGIKTGLGDQERDVIAKTTDGGATWVSVMDTIQDPPFGLIAIAAPDDMHIIAVGREGKLFHSSDGGSSWEHAPRPFFLYEPACAEVTCSDGASAVAGGLFHIVTYTGQRTLASPVVATRHGAAALQYSAHWAPIAGATEYQLELAKDYHTNTIQFEIFDEQPYKQSGWITDTSLTLDPWLQLNRDYFIRVRARGGAYTSGWSWPVKFYTDGTSASEMPPAASGMEISLYPQPAIANTMLFVRSAPADAEWTLQIQDILGRVLVVETGRSSFSGEISQQIQLNNLPTGIYLTRFICSGTGRLLPLNIVRQ